MYVTTVLAVGVICALADTLMPEGAVKRVGKLVCGMALLCAVLKPVVSLDLSAGEKMARAYFEGIKREELRLDGQVNSGITAIIEKECAAYIVDKAAQLGITCQTQVVCEPDENGLPVPWKVRITGELTQEEQESLAGVVEGDLAIPRVRQEFYREEAVA